MERRPPRERAREREHTRTRSVAIFGYVQGATLRPDGTSSAVASLTSSLPAPPLLSRRLITDLKHHFDRCSILKNEAPPKIFE